MKGDAARVKAEDIQIIEEEEGWIRRSSSVLPNWRVKIRNFVISAQKTGSKLNKWTQ